MPYAHVVYSPPHKVTSSGQIVTAGNPAYDTTTGPTYSGGAVSSSVIGVQNAEKLSNAEPYIEAVFGSIFGLAVPDPLGGTMTVSAFGLLAFALPAALLLYLGHKRNKRNWMLAGAAFLSVWLIWIFSRADAIVADAIRNSVIGG